MTQETETMIKWIIGSQSSIMIRNKTFVKIAILHAQDMEDSDQNKELLFIPLSTKALSKN